MELGYTGVAYNRTITGVMSELDRCSISLFPLSSVLKLSPSISTAVNLHRSCLNVSTSTPFRQYTRLTIVVDSPAQGSALNSGNPVLKSYDIVAVRPLKQDAFDLACKTYEVDIIAIDFSETRFRLKQPLIKAAIERGVYFEITYSSLLMDAQLRRQVISNAKLLVDWTRGKNLIFSSAAPSINELRGPYDVANLACLLGFSTERAKASVSKTCRSLLESSLRKKRFFKEAIKVELISSAEKTDSFDDWLKWDPLSSGDGDLQLDDMAKSFAASNKDSKTVKAIDFVSIINELPSNGLHITVEGDSCKKGDMLNFGNCELSLANENIEMLASDDGGETCAMNIDEETKVQNELNESVSFHEIDQQNLQADVHEAVNEGNADTFSACLIAGITNSFDDNPTSTPQCEEADNICSNVSISPPMIESNEAEVLEEEHTRDTGDDAAVNTSLPVSGGSLKELVPEEHLSVIAEDVSVAPSRSDDELQNNGANSVVHEPLENGSMEVKVEVNADSQMNHVYTQESSSERVRRKQTSSHRSISFPFKRLLKPSHFKKLRKHKTKSPVLSLSDLVG